MLFAIVSRGKKLGTRLFPHRFNDNRYHVHLGKEGPYIPITDYRDIPAYLANGYSLQMSDGAQSRTPSLTHSKSNKTRINPWMEHELDPFLPHYLNLEIPPGAHDRAAGRVPCDKKVARPRHVPVLGRVHPAYSKDSECAGVWNV